MLQFSLLNGLGARVPGTSTIIAADNQQTSTTTVAQPVAGQCSADGQFIWRLNADGTGFWARRSATDVCAGTASSSGPVVRETGAEGGGGGVTVAPTRVMTVGPFTIPVVRRGESYIWGLDSYDKLKPDQAALLLKQLQVRIDGGNWIALAQKWPKYTDGDPQPGSTTHRYWNDGSVAATSTWPSSTGWGTWLTWLGWMRKIGFTGAQPGYDQHYMTFSSDGIPVAKFTHPDGGDYGLWARIQPVGSVIQATSTQWSNGDTTPDQTQSVQLQFKIAPMPSALMTGGIVGFIRDKVQTIAAGFYSGVISVAESLSDVLCAAAQTPGALTTAAAKGGPEAAAAGAATELLLNGKCPVSNPTPEGVPGPEPKQFPWGPVIAGGVALAGFVAFLLTPPKSKKKQAA
jgi:hypothetical protein